ncbi:MAG: lysophospholipase L1-like esterase [Candidatus Omnitrophota bacterium]|jgi:lysophospholipase L1-like esterase
MKVFVATLIILLGSSTMYANEIVNILAMGDSTTAGTPYYASPVESPPDGLGDITAQYPHWVEKALPNTEVYNRGIRGQRTDQMKSRLVKDLSKISPQVVVLLAGVNDVYQGLSPQVIISQIIFMHQLVKFDRAKFLLCSVLPYDEASLDANQRLQELNVMIEDYATRNSIPFCDTFKALEDPNKPFHLLGSDDGIHPDKETYKVLGETIAGCLSAVIAS